MHYVGPQVQAEDRVEPRRAHDRPNGDHANERAQVCRRSFIRRASTANGAHISSSNRKSDLAPAAAAALI
jgi:hypothetical protein